MPSSRSPQAITSQCCDTTYHSGAPTSTVRATFEELRLPMHLGTHRKPPGLAPRQKARAAVGEEAVAAALAAVAEDQAAELRVDRDDRSVRMLDLQGQAGRAGERPPLGAGGAARRGGARHCRATRGGQMTRKS